MRHLSIMMQEVFKEIEEYVLEKDRKRVEHVRFVIPGHNFQLLIMDSIKLLIDPDFRNDTSAIYFSINGKTKKGKRIIEIAEYCELFASYDVSIGGINYTRIKRFNLDPIELSNEIIRILMVLFPTLDLRDINVTLIRRDSWTTLHS